MMANTGNDYIDKSSSSKGVYVDLDSLDDTDVSSSDILKPATQQFDTTTYSYDDMNIEEWRSNYWVVLIDDESSIRLAIGDYLHANGYSVVTACDGPLSFLDVMLWSCSYSLRSDGEENIETPPWIQDNQNWRLPNCIISDIRMPGGIDGVQLLELLRQSNDGDKKDEKDIDTTTKKKKKRGRRSTKYDDKDDFDLLEEIGKSDIQQTIKTPTDQAKEYIDAIRSCIQHFLGQDKLSTDTKQYPNSLLQIPVVLLTAKAMVSDRIVGYKAGASGYLPKPFRPKELLGMLDNLMRKQERERRQQQYQQSNSNDSLDDDLTPEEIADITKELIEVKKLLQQREIKQQSSAEYHEMEQLLPEALWMLRNSEERKRVFTKEHIRSILLCCFGVDMPVKNNSRDKMMTKLEEQINKYPERLKAYEV